MPGTIRRAAQLHQPPALEHAIEDGLGEVGVVQHQPPRGERFVGGEDHRSPVQVTLVDDLEHQIGGVTTDGQVADLVDHQHRGVRVVRQRPGQFAAPRGPGEGLDHLGGAGEQGLVAVLDGAVGDGDGEVSLAGPGRPAEDQAATLADQLGAEATAEQLQPDRALEGEVELLDGAQEREAGLAHRTLDASLSPVRDLLGDDRGEEVTVGLVLGLGAQLALGVEPAHGGQVQTPEHAVEIERGHERTPSGNSSSTWWAA